MTFRKSFSGSFQTIPVIASLNVTLHDHLCVVSKSPAPILFSEIARLQEDSAGLDLPYFIHDPPQLRGVDGDGADLLPRVRGAAVGDRASGHALLRVRRQVPREVPGPAECRLFTK